MQVYDESKIGKLISWGSDHFVYNYDSDKVIKFSILDYINGHYEKALQDYTVSKKYFGEYLLHTEPFVSQNGKYVGKVQPKIIGHYLTAIDLDNPTIRVQFEDVISAYHAMLKAGEATIDFIGQPGVFRTCLSNIFVTNDNKLRIIDATLIGHDSLSSNFLKAFFYIGKPYLVWRQNSIIKTFTK